MGRLSRKTPKGNLRLLDRVLDRQQSHTTRALAIQSASPEDNNAWKRTVLLHFLQEFDNDLGRRSDQHLSSTTLFSVGDGFQAIGQNRHAHHGDIAAKQKNGRNRWVSNGTSFISVLFIHWHTDASTSTRAAPRFVRRLYSFDHLVVAGCHVKEALQQQIPSLIRPSILLPSFAPTIFQHSQPCCLHACGWRYASIHALVNSWWHTFVVLIGNKPSSRCSRCCRDDGQLIWRLVITLIHAVSSSTA